MEPSSIPTDPVGDNRPREVSGRGAQPLVYILITSLGVVFLTFGSYARWQHNESWIPELCIGMGVAIAAPGFLSYLYRRFLLDEIKLEIQQPAHQFKEAALAKVDQAIETVVGKYRREIDFLESAHTAGILGVYGKRIDAVQAFLPFMEEEQNEIRFICSSARGLLTESDIAYQNARTLISKRRSHGVRVSFLLTHPIVADLRARQENRQFSDIGKEIVESLEILLGQWKVPPGDIKLYLGTPTCFGIKTSGAMLLNPYPYGREAFSSPCLLVRRGGYFYDHFEANHFHAIISNMAVAVPMPVSKLKAQLQNYADTVHRMLEPPS